MTSIEGTVWRHPAGGLRRVICVARHESTGERQVISQSVETGRYYAIAETAWVIMERVAA